MKAEKIEKRIRQYLENDEMLGGSMILRQDGEIVFHQTWGYEDFERTRRTGDDSIYRIMSMTKPIIAAGILLLMDRGQLDIDDPVKKYIPAFGDTRVSTDAKYRIGPGFDLESIPKIMAEFRAEELETEPLKRDITLKDILSHSSGIGQGLASMCLMGFEAAPKGTLAEQVEEIAHTVLDFQPGSDTGYSPSVAFNVLGRVIEVVSGKSLEEFCETEFFKPLGMENTGFRLSEEQRKRLVPLCICRDGKLVDITEEHDGNPDIFASHEGYVSGSGGLFSTLTDYEHFAQMLYDNGYYNGRQFLKPETVALMRTEAPENHMECLPGQAWGLGVRIRQDAEKIGYPITEDTYGWSGAFGSHFFISPRDDLECVFMLNRGDVAGSESYITLELEKLIFEAYAKKPEEQTLL